MLGRFETKLTEYQTILYFDDATQSNKLISIAKNPSYPDLGFFKPTIDTVEGLRHLQTPEGPVVLPQLPAEKPQATYIGQSYSHIKT
jgi:hypothetical protein